MRGRRRIRLLALDRLQALAIGSPEDASQGSVRIRRRRCLACDQGADPFGDDPRSQRSVPKRRLLQSCTPTIDESPRIRAHARPKRPCIGRRPSQHRLPSREPKPQEEQAHPRAGEGDPSSRPGRCHPQRARKEVSRCRRDGRPRAEERDLAGADTVGRGDSANAASIRLGRVVGAAFQRRASSSGRLTIAGPRPRLCRPPFLPRPKRWHRRDRPSPDDELQHSAAALVAHRAP